MPTGVPNRTKPPAKAKPDGEICGECWPDGWPSDGQHAGCVHGDWHR